MSFTRLNGRVAVADCRRSSLPSLSFLNLYLTSCVLRSRYLHLRHRALPVWIPVCQLPLYCLLHFVIVKSAGDCLLCIMLHFVIGIAGGCLRCSIRFLRDIHSGQSVLPL